jgi:TorA maturation chaperone TorD
LSQVPPLEAHSFLVEHDTRKLTLAKLLEAKNSEILAWAEKIQKWVEQSAKLDVYSLVQVIGQEVFLDTAKNHEELTRRVEI